MTDYMDFKPGLVTIAPAEADEIQREARQQGIPLYVISTGGRAGKKVFFEAVRDALPLDPPMDRIPEICNWDALSDSLRGGIDSLDEDHIVILWPDSSPFSRLAPHELETALFTLAEVADSLSDPSYTVGNPTQVSVYVGKASK